MRNAYILFGKPRGRIPLERPRCRWEDNIRLDLREHSNENSGSIIGGECD
jgi:hypothetical protein